MTTSTRWADEQTIIERRCRATGTKVALVYNESADPSQPWETVCCEHGGVCSHETRTLAEDWLSHPDEWCEDCMYGEGTLSGERPAPSAQDAPVITDDTHGTEADRWAR